MVHAKQKAVGLWFKEERRTHINELELRTIMFGVKLFAKTHSHLLIQTDSITAIRYVNKIGGTHSKTLCDLSLEIHKRCVIHNIRLTAEHLPGKDNTLADRLSRQSNQDWSDWKLSPTVFNHILVTTQLTPSIDLFASRPRT